MKVGSVFRLKDPHPSLVEEEGWLWVYEGKNGRGGHMFKAVATGNIESTRYPWRAFENWEDEDEDRQSAQAEG
jgi:hypothetical protein